MATTIDVSSIDQFARLPDELLEKIFVSLNNDFPFTPTNHVRLDFNSCYFDYSIQQPLLKQTHIELLQLSLVCRRFHQIIKSSRFWEKKCRQDHVLLPNQHLPIDFNAYDKLYINNPFHPSFNLLQDENWKKSKYTSSQIEPAPHGTYPLYDEFNRLSPCRATSHTLAEFYQRDISLTCKGSGSNEVGHLRPIIEFSICIAPRWDCGSQCSISLLFSDGHRWQCQRTFPQWNDAQWHRIIYRYGEYEQFPSSVTVDLTGCDTQGWAGFFGMKFAQARLHLLIRTNDNGMNEENEVLIQPKAEDKPNKESQPDALDDNLSIDEISSTGQHADWNSDGDENEDMYDSDD